MKVLAAVFAVCGIRVYDLARMVGAGVQVWLDPATGGRGREILDRVVFDATALAENCREAKRGVAQAPRR